MGILTAFLERCRWVAGRIFPGLDLRCQACGQLLPDACEALNLCLGCADLLAPRLKGYCPGCAEVFPSSEEEVRLCASCAANPRPWDKVAFHGIYDGLLKELILDFKFNSSLRRTRLLGSLMLDAQERSGYRPDIIVPVPLHSMRLFRRGFNQSQEMAVFLGRRIGVPVDNRALLRNRATLPQARLARSERLLNIKGAFTADPGKVGDRRVLLVDDIMTTGSTIGECAGELKRAGAAEVGVIVLARA